MRDVYTTVTEQIVAAIEAGQGKYVMPWHCKDIAYSPVSINGLRAYRGVNTVCLWATSQQCGYPSGLWGTYKNWQDVGGHVRKGEKSTTVVFWGVVKGKETAAVPADGDGDAERGHMFCRGYSVFNLAQVDGVTLPKPKVRTVEDRIATADAWFGSLGGKVNHGFNRAFYSPDNDYIGMPEYEQFKSAMGYYSVLAHEYTHWTSHATRTARELGKRFGDEAYAVEELIAELGSAYVGATLQLEPEPRLDHAAYCRSWLKVLRSDKRAIFTAASQAQKATDYLVALAKANAGTATMEVAA